jgi:quercetin dioxygenase-like cupin family protein
VIPKYLPVLEESRMPRLIAAPTVIAAAGNKPKQIEEFIGRVNSGNHEVSIARMKSPPGWVEPGQRPDFEEISVVLTGALHVEHESGTMDVNAGQAVLCQPGEWVRYSTPQGAEYIAICLPAFSPNSVHRD